MRSRRQLHILLQWFATVLLNLFLISVQAAQPFKLEIVDVEPPQFNPSIHEQAKIRFKSQRDGQASVKIFDRRGCQVREMMIEHVTANEIVTTAWNGKDGEGRLVTDEAYFFTIEAVDIRGRIVEYNPVRSPVNRSVPMKVQYDVAKALLSFTLEQDGVIDIRSGVADGGPLLTKLIEWRPFPQGQYTVDWDGWDQSHTVSVDSISQHHLYSQFVALPEYSLFTHGHPNGDDRLYSQAFPDESRMCMNSDLDRLFSQSDVLPYKSLSPVFAFSFNDVDVTRNDTPVLPPGPFGITIRLEESVKQRVTESRYEILVFVDFQFVTEIEEGRSPARINIDASNLSAGEHVLTVNLVTLKGGVAALSKRFVTR